MIAFLVTTTFLWAFQTDLAEKNAISILEINISDVEQDITDASDENLLMLTRLVANELDSVMGREAEYLEGLVKKYDISEINVIDENGIITASTYEDFLGYDMASGEQSGEFMVIGNGAEEYVQSYQPVSYDASISRKYAGVELKKGGFVQVGYDAERFQKDIDSQVIGVTKNRHVGKGGCIIITDEKWNVVSNREEGREEELNLMGITEKIATVPEKTIFTEKVYGEQCYCMYVKSEGYYIIAVMPESEALLSRNVSVGITSMMELVIFASLFVMIYMLIKKLVVNNINKVNSSLSKITGGNLDTMVDVRSQEEFSSLSDDINSTVATLKHYIADAAARIDAELEFARAIQHSALPSVFPPYPNRKEFEIWASMDSAKEVGGDFYDFYFVNKNTFAFLVADVSGKGIPAAMFMMTAKTLIKSYAESGMSAEDIFTFANNKLCEGNDAGMFVTAWMGFLDTETGKVTFVNAGHNPPVIRHANGEAEYIRCRAGFILAGMEETKYKKQEMQLEPGDMLYLYTDGVTEATDSSEQLYGEERLLSAMKDPAENVKELCGRIRKDVDGFVGEAPQFDDITMLCIQYKGKEEV